MICGDFKEMADGSIRVCREDRDHDGVHINGFYRWGRVADLPPVTASERDAFVVALLMSSAHARRYDRYAHATP